MRYYWWMVFTLLSCAYRPAEPDTAPVERAFYYWRSDFSLSDAESRAVAQLGISALYTRFFDVVWEGNAPTPGSVFSFSAPPPIGVDIVPTVFLRNEVFVRTSRGEATFRLTRRVFGRIRSIAATQREGLQESSRPHFESFDPIEKTLCPGDDFS